MHAQDLHFAEPINTESISIVRNALAEPIRRTLFKQVEILLLPKIYFKVIPDSVVAVGTEIFNALAIAICSRSATVAY